MSDGPRADQPPCLLVSFCFTTASSPCLRPLFLFSLHHPSIPFSCRSFALPPLLLHGPTIVDCCRPTLTFVVRRAQTLRAQGATSIRHSRPHFSSFTVVHPPSRPSFFRGRGIHRRRDSNYAPISILLCWLKLDSPLLEPNNRHTSDYTRNCIRPVLTSAGLT